MSAEHRQRYNSRLEEIKRQQQQEQDRIHAECRAWCTQTWKSAPDATDTHPYLAAKGVRSYGLKLFRDCLMIPVEGIGGDIFGVQFIAPDGRKNFKTGTAKTGHFFVIRGDDSIVICEGYATGASIHQATGHAVIVAFDAGNLLSIAKAMREKYPDVRIIIAADDDHQSEGNPGLIKASKAARAIGGLLAVPMFAENKGANDTDLNDLARLSGLEAVCECIANAAPPPEIPNGKPESLEAAIRRLAALSPLQYDRVRNQAAKEFGVRPATLDAEVKAARKEKPQDLPLTGVEPWPEPVSSQDLLTDISTAIRKSPSPPPCGAP